MLEVGRRSAAVVESKSGGIGCGGVVMVRAMAARAATRK